MLKKDKERKAKAFNRGTQVCSKLTGWRSKAGLSQAEASEVLGINVRTYQNWEQQRRRPTGLSLTTLENFIRKVESKAASAAA